MIPGREDEEQFDDDDEFSLGDDDEDDSFETDTDEENEADFDESWIAWFVRQRGNEFFCEVDREFINNPQSIAGLLTQVSHATLALNVILDEKVAEHESLREDQRNIIEKQAEILYGLIHSRFINTTRGLRLMYSKYERGDFGKCPRFFCQNEKALPAAEYDSQGRGQLKQYCPRCEKLFLPGTKLHRELDCSFIGTVFLSSFRNAFPQVFANGSSQSNQDNGLDTQPGQPPNVNVRRGPPQKYIPRPYGFRLFTGSQRSLQDFIDSHTPAPQKLNEMPHYQGRIQQLRKMQIAQQQRNMQQQQIQQLGQNTQSSSLTPFQQQQQILQQQQSSSMQPISHLNPHQPFQSSLQVTQSSQQGALLAQQPFRSQQQIQQQQSHQYPPSFQHYLQNQPQLTSSLQHEQGIPPYQHYQQIYQSSIHPTQAQSSPSHIIPPFSAAVHSNVNSSSTSPSQSPQLASSINVLNIHSPIHARLGNSGTEDSTGPDGANSDQISYFQRRQISRLTQPAGKAMDKQSDTKQNSL